MAVLHNSLAGSDLHEPKGVATAPAGSVYRADGGGSGSWSYPDSAISVEPLIANDIVAVVLAPVASDSVVTSLVLALGGAISGPATVSVMDAGGIPVASVTVPAGALGASVTTPLDIALPAGSHIRLRVSEAATEATKIYPSLKLRFQ